MTDTFEAIVFDMDGVLIETEPIWEEVRRAYVADNGGTWLPEAQSALMGMSTPEWARYLSEDLGVGQAPETVADEVISAMLRRYDDDIPQLPGADAALRACSARWPVAVATSSPLRLVRHVVDVAGWMPLLQAIVSSEEVAAGKPAPDVYLEAARRLGVDPVHCAAVEDSSNGVRSAAAAGLTVIAVPSPRYPLDEDVQSLAVVTLGGLDELVDVLQAGRSR